MINKNIFRGYDIRGVYPSDINSDVAYLIGRAFGSYIKGNCCVVGHDNRYSSEELTESLIKGITESGVDVYYLGLCTTPMYYFGCLNLKIESGIMVTASHNPKDDNGFKFALENYLNAKGEEIIKFRDFVLENNFKEGKGKIFNINIKEDYFKLMQESIKLGNRKIKVLVDCANATTSYFAKDLYSKFNIELEMLYDTPDSSFPNHHPDPCVTKNNEMLMKKVVEGGFDIGIGFDGDGDRVGVVDEKGNHLGIDEVMIIIARDIIKNNKDNIPFGGEYSGHLMFNDKFMGFDSGMYAGLRMIEILSRTSKNVSELLDGVNKYYSTEELKFNSPDDIKFEVINKLIKDYPECLTIDGMKMVYDDGFALVRASNTGPTITARFEATTKKRLEELQKEFVDKINLYNKK